MTELKRRIK